jgi:hypothetical protein
MGSLMARPHLLRMVSRVTRNHAGANASRNHVHRGQARYDIVAQQSVHPDVWESARFQALFLAGSGFRQNGVISARPAAGNASRWAA